MIRDLAGFARVAGGALQGENAAFGPVASDSRTLEPGALFVALAGENFDGHDFVAQAAARGAAGAVVNRPVAGTNGAGISLVGHHEILIPLIAAALIT